MFDFFKTKNKKIRKSKDGEKLTNEEAKFIKQYDKKYGIIPCINCREYALAEGPSGGLSINLCCPNCGQGINFTQFNGQGINFTRFDNIGINEDFIINDKEELINFKIK